MSRSGWDLRLCIFHKLPADAGVAIPRTTPTSKALYTTALKRRRADERERERRRHEDPYSGSIQSNDHYQANKES